MNREERYGWILRYFSENMPVAESELHFENPYQLICAVMLSAQCTDKRVNLTTPLLFERYPDIQSLAEADIDNVRDIIRSISYPNAKAAHLVEMARIVCTGFNGEIPSTIDELLELPGVGRKTANVVTSILYDEPVIAVDTHVFRVAHRLGLSEGSTPLAVEKDLESNIPGHLRPIAHHWLILHGRYICKARTPLCKECALKQACEHYFTTGQTAL